MTEKYPGRQNMVSRSPIGKVREELAFAMRYANAECSDIWISGYHDIPESDRWDYQRHGFRTRYTLVWTSHAGWRAYMFTTGIMTL